MFSVRLLREGREALGSAWPDAIPAGVLDAMRVELEGLVWDEEADASIAWTSEHAGIGARRLRRLLAPDVALKVVHDRLTRGRAILEGWRRGRPPGTTDPNRINRT